MMPTVTILTWLCVSITPPVWLTYIKSLSDIGTHLNIAYSPLYSCRCSFPMEALNVPVAGLLWAV